VKLLLQTDNGSFVMLVDTVIVVTWIIYAAGADDIFVIS